MRTYEPRTRSVKWDDVENDALRFAWAQFSGSKVKVARALGLSEGQVDGQSRRLGLHSYRFRPMRLKASNPAIVENRTRFPGRVSAPIGPNILKPGHHSRKLGGVVTKGKWKGFPVYSLTLEERATCPTSCELWNSCYGNRMHQATRYMHGPELERRLHIELRALQAEHPGGFVVRLHVLGDFYSVGYVERWAGWLLEFPALHVFGYTHWPVDTPIGYAIDAYRRVAWGRFAVRTSGAPDGPRTAVVPAGPLMALREPDAVVCPAQTGRTASCATCSLCWASTRPIVFMEH